MGRRAGNGTIMKYEEELELSGMTPFSRWAVLDGCRVGGGGGLDLAGGALMGGWWSVSGLALAVGFVEGRVCSY